MKNLLMVDDEAPIREWLAACAKEHEKVSEAYTARNGEEALKLLETCRIDIVFTDITMPKLDGLSLLERINAVRPETAVVVISVSDEFEYARKAIKCDACDYVLKNELSKEKVLQLIDNIIDGKAAAKAAEARSRIAEFSLDLIIRSKYLQHMLTYGDSEVSAEDLVQNRIGLSGGLLFGAALPYRPEKAEKLNLGAWKNIANVTFFSYGENKLLLIANIMVDDMREVERIAAYIKSVVGGNIGYSKIYEGLDGFLPASREAIAMREYMFYCPDRWRGFENHKPDDKSIKAEMWVISEEVLEAFKRRGGEKAVALFREFIGYIESKKPGDIYFVKESIALLCQQIFSASCLMEFDFKRFRKQLFECVTLSEAKALLEDFYVRMESFERYSENISKAIEYIDKNYMVQISLRDVADSIFLSEEYFSRLFKKEAGVNFSEYLTRLRMDKAMRLLMTTDMSVAAVAQAVGVSNAKYFSLLFKKYFEKTPTQMRING